jgi:hypothetical protein
MRRVDEAYGRSMLLRQSTRDLRYLLLCPVSSQQTRVPDTWSGAPQVTVNITRLQAFHFVSLIGNEYNCFPSKVSKYKSLAHRYKRDRYCWHADEVEPTSFCQFKLHTVLPCY